MSAKLEETASKTSVTIQESEVKMSVKTQETVFKMSVKLEETAFKMSVKVPTACHKYMRPNHALPWSVKAVCSESNLGKPQALKNYLVAELFCDRVYQSNLQSKVRIDVVHLRRLAVAHLESMTFVLLSSCQGSCYK